MSISNHHFEEFLSTPNENYTQECYTCRRVDVDDRLKSNEHSNQLIAMKKEEIKLKSVHRQLELRIKQFLHRTRNALRTEEKLIELEKTSQNELLKRSHLIPAKTSSKDNENLLKNVQKIQENNRQLEENIDSICHQIKQLETQFDEISLKKTNPQIIEKHRDDQLHRMNLQLSKISIDNSQLHLDIKRMLDKRRQLTENYNHLQTKMQKTTDQSRQLTSQCSESFAHRRNLVARMRSMHAQHDQDEKKLLENLREFDRLLENNSASKNFILKKSDHRHEQVQLNELFAGKRSEGTKYAYTADEFRRVFRHYFHQDLTKEKLLNQTIETFLNEQDQAFALFQYAVELINELNHQHETLEQKRMSISAMSSKDNLDSFLLKDRFAKLERSVNEMTVNVQSVEFAKTNLRQTLDRAYAIISNLFVELQCQGNRYFLSNETIHDRNILRYLASIESCVYELIFKKKSNRKLRTNLSSTNETTISWRIDQQQQIEQSLHSLSKLFVEQNREKIKYLQQIDSIIPKISLNEQLQIVDKDQIQPDEIVSSVLDAYNRTNLGR